MNTAPAPAANPALTAAAFTPDDGKRLTLYYTLERDLLALADQTGAAVVELVAWMNLPHIAAAIACIDHHRALGRADRAAAGMVKALDASEDPVETRRHANLLLRIIRPPAPRTPRRTRDAVEAVAAPDPLDSTSQDHAAASATTRLAAQAGQLSSPSPPRGGAWAPPSSAPSDPAPPRGSSR